MKMRNVKKITIAMLMITLTSATVVCQSRTPEAGLIGKWFFEEFDVGGMVVVEFMKTEVSVYVFSHNETLTCEYMADGKTIDMDGYLYSYTIQSGNVLKMTDLFGNEFIGKKLQANITSLIGRYELVNDVGFFTALEFIDTKTVAIHAEMLGITNRTIFSYRISGSNLIISNSGGSLALDIIGDRIIMGNILGITNGEKSVFIKK